MDDIRCPAKLLDGFQHAARKKYSPFVIVGKELSVLVAEGLLALEVVLVINEIYLDAGR